ncbi:MAG TPA: TonB family protein [Pyrinomonadaceae bacterium]|jgi:TonB family protein|nr:TonB family protein [Pyrinomonadaceae bacterium]
MRRSIHLMLGAAACAVFCLSGVSAQDAPRTIVGGIVNGKAVKLPKPEYPTEAKASRLEGTVIVNVVINENGDVESAEAAIEQQKLGRQKTAQPGQDPDFVMIQPADPILRDAAVRAALEAKFSPTLLSGQPVKVKGMIVYNFVASDQPEAVKDAIKGGILNGKATSLPSPAYPPAALAVGAEGQVAVQITIDENGLVTAASAVSGHPLLRAAAVEAARNATFPPTRLEGRPVKVTGVLVYNFDK